MKINNETKIGALTIVAIVFLFLGFNFLKGKSIFKNGFYLYAKFPESKGIVGSNPVFINGFQAGTVSEVSASKDLKEILVEIKLNQDYNIPDSSLANINSNPLGTSSVEITLGKSTKFLSSKDTLITSLTPGFLGMVGSQIKPLAEQAKNTLQDFDSVMLNINQILDSTGKENLQQIIVNLNNITQGLVTTTHSFNEALNFQTGAFAGIVRNFDDFSKNLAANNGKLDSIMTNMQKTTNNLSEADIKGVMDKLKGSVDSLNLVFAKINSTDGTLGAIINSKELYNNLNTTTNSLRILLDDLRVHPKRYVNISVFGKKDKGNYLVKPLPQDTLSSSTQK
ncbi:MAG TPA: MlaD family protein [Arachidicoccus soli]|jgi:phospholipid/cholesterol/gamma-HCH transport system substrate-binding protein|nr:MlaD family protein [Arachidicoccus soli]